MTHLVSALNAIRKAICPSVWKKTRLGAVFGAAKILGFGGPVLLLTSTASASVHVQAFEGINGTFQSISSDTAPISASANVNSNVGTMDAFSYADYGINRVSAKGANNPGYFPFVEASALASWNDLFTLTTPGFTNGFLIVGVDVTSNLAVTRTGSITVPSAVFQYTLAGAGLSIYADISGVTSSSTSFLTDTVRDAFGMSRLLTVSIPFTSGSQFSIQSDALCAISLNAGDGVNTGSCDAANSVYWAGVFSVTDSAGNAISNWSMSSASGTDYTKSFVPTSTSSVPEPSLWIMTILGFGLIGTMMRHPKMRHPKFRSGAAVA